MSIATKLHTWLNGKLVGQDEFGNRYYLSRRKDEMGKYRRWVLYKGVPEASKVPASWHGWLHYTTDQLPDSSSMIYAWQKPHVPNLTGTKAAYYPEGHVTRGGKRAKATGDYEPWNP